MNGIGQLLLASLLWSLSFGLIKGQLTDVHPAFVGFARLALTLPIFVPMLRLTGVTTQDRIRLIGIGAVQYGLAYSTYLYAFQFLQGHHVALLTIFTPLFVVVFDAIQRRHTPWAPLGFASIAVLGAAVIQYRGVSWSGVLIGVLLMQIANACFAWGQLAYRKLRCRRRDLDDKAVFGLLFIGGTLVTAATTTTLGGWSSTAVLTGQQLSVLAYLGIVATGIGFFAWNHGAVRTPAATLAVMNNLKIPLAVAASVLVFDEATNLPRLLCGGAMMLGAAIAAQRWARSQTD